MKKRWTFVVAGVMAAVTSAGCMGSEDPAATNAPGADVVLLDESEASPDPVASMKEPSDPAEERVATDQSEITYCWVTLDYCIDPRTGTGTCHQNGGCSTSQFLKNCIALYEQTC